MSEDTEEITPPCHVHVAFKKQPDYTGELGYDGPLYDRFLHMTDYIDYMVPVRCLSSICHMYMTDFAYDGPIFLVPLSLSYPSSPVIHFPTNVTIGIVIYFQQKCLLEFV